jgi:hypothetical protein
MEELLSEASDDCVNVGEALCAVGEALWALGELTASTWERRFAPWERADPARRFAPQHSKPFGREPASGDVR